MTPRPLHRSKTLWLGIITLIFLTWAWYVSLDRFTLLRQDCSFRWFAIGQYHGQVGLFSGDRSGQWTSHVTDVPRASRVPSCREFWERGATTSGVIIASHQMLILAFTLPWLALLIWRQGRIKRLTTKSPA